MPTIFGYYSQLTCVVCSICRFDTGLRVLTGFGGFASADTPFIAKYAMNGVSETHISESRCGALGFIAFGAKADGPALH
jgi:hypothetical protein